MCSLYPGWDPAYCLHDCMGRGSGLAQIEYNPSRYDMVADSDDDDYSVDWTNGKLAQISSGRYMFDDGRSGGRSRGGSRG